MKRSRVLLDTQAFLWFVFADPRLSSKAGKVIENSRVEKVLSIISLWEIALKVSLRKLELGTTYDRFIEENVRTRILEVLPVELAHLSSYTRLPFHHRDPFDRLLIAQCQVERLPIVTVDAHFSPYGVDIVW